MAIAAATDPKLKDVNGKPVADDLARITKQLSPAQITQMNQAAADVTARIAKNTQGLDPKINAAPHIADILPHHRRPKPAHVDPPRQTVDTTTGDPKPVQTTGAATTTATGDPKPVQTTGAATTTNTGDPKPMQTTGAATTTNTGDPKPVQAAGTDATTANGTPGSLQDTIAADRARIKDALDARAAKDPSIKPLADYADAHPTGQITATATGTPAGKPLDTNGFMTAEVDASSAIRTRPAEDAAIYQRDLTDYNAKYHLDAKPQTLPPKPGQTPQQWLESDNQWRAGEQIYRDKYLGGVNGQPAVPARANRGDMGSLKGQPQTQTPQDDRAFTADAGVKAGPADTGPKGTRLASVKFGSFS